MCMESIRIGQETKEKLLKLLPGVISSADYQSKSAFLSVSDFSLNIVLTKTIKQILECLCVIFTFSTFKRSAYLIPPLPDRDEDLDLGLKLYSNI